MNRIKIFGLIFSLIFFASCLSDDSSTTNTPGATGLTLKDSFPGSETTSVPANAQFVFTFSEDITVDTGIVEIWSTDNTGDTADSTLDVTAAVDYIDGDRIFIPKEALNLTPGKTYFVIIPSGAIKSKDGGKSFAGVGVGETTSDTSTDHKFYFTTIADASVVDIAATDVTISHITGSKQVKLLFGKDVIKGQATMAKIQVYSADNTDDAITELDISGDSVNVNSGEKHGSREYYFDPSPDSTLPAGKDYFLKITEKDSFVDVIGNGLVTVDNTTDFKFDTK